MAAERRFVVLAVAAACALALTITVLAQTKDPPEPEGEKVVVKTYADMAEAAVFQLSRERRTEAVPVRFTTAFKDLLRPKPEALDLFTIGRARIDPLLVFDTQGEMTCLVTRKDITLLRRAVDLVRGQQVVIEGVVIPEHAGYKLVIVDDIKFATTEKRDVKWEVIVFWPNEKPKLIRQPGTYTMLLPVPANLKDNQVEFKIELRRVREIGEKAGEKEPPK